MTSDDFQIKAVRARSLDIPMRKAFGIAGGAQEVARNVLVELELGSGVRGWGEAAPLPAFDGETQGAALAAIDVAGEWLVGRDARSWRALAAEAPLATASARCAIETALLDALTRALDISLRVFFGGAENELVSDVTITTGTVDEARHEARAFAAFHTLKIKVGGGAAHDVGHDVARVLAIAGARPDARLLLDANASFSIDEAVFLANELRRHGVTPAIFEQPIAPGNAEALAEARGRMGLPVAADESVRQARDVIALHHARAIDFVNIKLMKSGIVAALDVAAAARACGLGLMVGGMVETRLAMGTSACFAAGLGGFVLVDLDTPLFLAADPFEGGYAQQGERLDVRPIDVGHGCTPRSIT